jgi:hypothetical protein
MAALEPRAHPAWRNCPRPGCFSASSQVARVQALLRRSSGHADPVLRAGVVAVDPRTNTVTVADQPYIIDVEAMLVPPLHGQTDLPAIASGLVAMPLSVHPDLPAAALGALTYDAAITSGIEAGDMQGRRGSGFDTVTHTHDDGRAWVSMVMDERRPTMAGFPPDLFEWWSAFESGYRCASRALVRQAAVLHALLERHADDRSRMIVQGTFDYYRAMQASWNGRYDDDTRRRTLALIRTMKAWHYPRLLDLPALAWVEGVLPVSDDWQTIDLPILLDWPNRPVHIIDASGKPSVTLWRCVQQHATLPGSLLELQPQTGRTHQLRVHLKAIGHPIWGDAMYAPPDVWACAPRLMLHAQRLAFTHPATGQDLAFEHTPVGWLNPDMLLRAQDMPW